jgi:hypothetical protein
MPGVRIFFNNQSVVWSDTVVKFVTCSNDPHIFRGFKGVVELVDSYNFFWASDRVKWRDFQAMMERYRK